MLAHRISAQVHDLRDHGIGLAARHPEEAFDLSVREARLIIGRDEARELTRRLEDKSADRLREHQRLRRGICALLPGEGYRSVRVARDMRGDGETIVDVVPTRPRQYRFVAAPRPREGLHVVPEEPRGAATTCAMDGITDAKALFVEPARPILRIIVDAQPLIGGGQEVDVMAEREPRASEPRAGLVENIDQCVFARDLQDFGRESLRGIERRHFDPWQCRRRSRTSLSGIAPCPVPIPSPSQTAGSPRWRIDAGRKRCGADTSYNVTEIFQTYSVVSLNLRVVVADRSASGTGLCRKRYPAWRWRNCPARRARPDVRAMEVRKSLAGWTEGKLI
ncbi:protein of unknown function [uncultured Sphingopyxis sp.]|uniref:Uncharacterized protein n=1 Tax=uncultured Sphingopyxis sp. TaxID=310581 RepID=A0A1Y5PRF9_9SPHN|nr:protein of unknown function [uncultured Sphingopyxis sp.]